MFVASSDTVELNITYCRCPRWNNGGSTDEVRDLPCRYLRNYSGENRVGIGNLDPSVA